MSRRVAELEWMGGLMLFAAGTGLITQWARTGPAPTDVSLVGLVGMALLVTLPLAPFLAIGAGVLSRPGWLAAAGRWTLVIGLASWSVLWMLYLSFALAGGGTSCGPTALRECGAPLSFYLAVILTFAGVYGASWMLARAVARLES